MNDFFDFLFDGLAEISRWHAPGTAIYRTLQMACRKEVEARFSDREAQARPFGPFGPLCYPYVGMGAVDSLDILGLDELIVFAFYWRNQGRYRKVVDLGANIGLHSVILDRCGFQVTAYEPDPRHLDRMAATLKLNGCTRVRVVPAAVSIAEGREDFIRVCGNTTGSHLSGAKPNPYGELERFTVPTCAFGEAVRGADFVKIDIEGHEAAVIEASRADDWENLEAMVEIGTAENAQAIGRCLGRLGLHAYSQKTGWQKATEAAHWPTSYREGLVFLTRCKAMDWDRRPESVPQSSRNGQ